MAGSERPTGTAPPPAAPEPSESEPPEPPGERTPRAEEATRPAPRRRAWWDRIAGTAKGNAAAALLAYVGASLAVFGGPILSHPGREFVGWGTDPSSFMWYLAWWPHAVGHGLNPLVTQDVWAPVGFNLTHATAVPLPALALTPATLLFGPVVAYNVMALLTPALSAWTGYLLCRYLTRSFWPALAGGYLFGFSVYVTGQMLGHPNLALVFLVPVVVLVVLKRMAGDLSARRAVLWLSAALVGQFLISLEVFMTVVLFGGLALGLAALTLPGQRRRLREAAIAAGAAFGLTAVVVSPFLWSFFSASNHAPVYDFYPTIFATDLDNFLVPTQLTRLGSQAFWPVTQRFTGDISEQAAYFGLPVLLMVGGFAVSLWRRPWSRWLLGFTALVVVLSLGPRLHVGGAPTITMPWRAALSLPLVKYALPGRFMAYAWLAVAVMVASWLAVRPGGVGRWLLAALAAVVLFPNVWGPFWHTPVREPAFFADGTYRREIPRGATVLVVPYGANGDSMLWQADSGFWFRMAGGNVGTRPPPEFGAWPIMGALYDGQPIANGALELRRFLGANRVSRVVVVHGTPGRWAAVFRPLGRPRSLGGIDLYTVPGSILRAYAGAPRPPG
jgi:hypothetical protein